LFELLILSDYYPIDNPKEIRLHQALAIFKKAFQRLPCLINKYLFKFAYLTTTT